MGHTDSALADAHRETDAAGAAALGLEHYVANREAELQRLMLAPLTALVEAHWAYSSSDKPVPAGEDFAAWLSMQGDRDVAAAIWSATDRRRLVDQYVQARARIDANDQRIDWRAVALEDDRWERAGRP